jgi:hypothetical protein
MFARMRLARVAAVSLVSTLVACVVESAPRESPGTSAEGLEATCQANVQGVGLVPAETDYLPHVVQCENGDGSLESLKAQAIASRTFLAYKMATSGVVSAGTGDQRYECGKTPTPLQVQAVTETSGLTLQYAGKTIASYFVAGGLSQPPDCMGGADPTGTQSYVTYNQGKTGANVTQSAKGRIDPANDLNRGCLSQNGANCLAGEGKSDVEILRFFYGDDVEIVQASGPCVAGGGGAPAGSASQGGCSTTNGRAPASLAPVVAAVVALVGGRRRRSRAVSAPSSSAARGRRGPRRSGDRACAGGSGDPAHAGGSGDPASAGGSGDPGCAAGSDDPASAVGSDDPAPREARPALPAAAGGPAAPGARLPRGS